MFETFEEEVDIFNWEEAVGIVYVCHNDWFSAIAVIEEVAYGCAEFGTVEEFCIYFLEDVGEDEASKERRERASLCETFCYFNSLPLAIEVSVHSIVCCFV